MIGRMVTADFIDVQVPCKDWKEAIHAGAKLLEIQGVVEERYKEEVIKNFYELGPYMVIAPGIVLSHARPEAGVNKVGISIINLKDSVEFGIEHNDPVKLVITLAAVDNTSHLQYLSKLMELLMNEDDLNVLFNANQVQEIVDVLEKYN